MNKKVSMLLNGDRKQEVIDTIIGLDYHNTNISCFDVGRIINDKFKVKLNKGQIRSLILTIDKNIPNIPTSSANTKNACIRTHEISLNKISQIKYVIKGMGLKNGDEVDIRELCKRLHGTYKLASVYQIIKGTGAYKNNGSRDILKDVITVKDGKVFYNDDNMQNNKVPYKGSDKAMQAAKKAIATKIERGLIKPDKCEKVKNYDMPKKNEFRNRVVSKFKKDKGTLTLSLESWQLKFVDALPLCRHIIFEHDGETYKKLIESNRKNMEVYFADVTAARLLPPHYRFEQAFLDFCNSMESNLEKVEELAGVLNWCDVIAFEFSVRDGGKSSKKSEINNYMGRACSEINRLFWAYDIISAEVYSDTSPMIGIIIKRRGDALYNNFGRQIEKNDYEKAFYIRLWAEEYSQKKWGIGIQILNQNEDKFNEMCNDMPKWILQNLKDLLYRYNLKDYENQLKYTLQDFFVSNILIKQPDTWDRRTFDDEYLKFVKEHTLDNSANAALQTIKEMETVLNIYKKRIGN